MDHGWINVDAVTTTEHLSKVYNLRVEQDHTYFVGATTWGFAVWVHNDYSFGAFINKIADVFKVERDASGNVLKDAAGNEIKTKVGTLTEIEVDGKPKYKYKSEVNKDANGNFYEEVFDTPEAALAKFKAEAAKAAAGNATAGLGETQKVDGDGGGAAGKLPGIDTKAVTPPNYRMGKGVAGRHPALMIDGKVYVHYHHLAAQELAGSRPKPSDLYGFVELDANGNVISAHWVEIGL